MGNTQSAAEYLKELEELQAEALRQVGDTHDHLKQAQQMHENAVLLANEAGCSNTAIAQACGKTETAIRLWLKRRKMSPEARRMARQKVAK